MSAPRFWKERADEDVREVTGMHGGVGAIRIRRFFPDLTTTGVSMDIWELAPGTTEGRHTHASTDPVDDYEEIYVVLAGQGLLELEGEDVPLEPGDAVLVPVDVDHGLRVTGDVPLRILLIFAHPRS